MASDARTRAATTSAGGCGVEDQVGRADVHVVDLTDPDRGRRRDRAGAPAGSGNDTNDTPTGTGTAVIEQTGGLMVDIVVTGRKMEVSARLRTYAAEKLAKVDKLSPKAIRFEVEVSRERNPRLSGVCERVELTCVCRGPVIRAEAAAADAVAAFDLAWTKLESRLRRSADRRRVHRGSRRPVSVATATATTANAAVDAIAGPPPAEGVVEQPVEQDGPLVVREKLHFASPMTLDQALYEMELVGHDFFLFCDKDSALPSVVYRRRGYDYGVIRIAASSTDSVGGNAAGEHVVDNGAVPGGAGYRPTLTEDPAEQAYARRAALNHESAV